MPGVSKSRPKLKVHTEGTRSFVHIPSGKAQSVRDHLRKNGIASLNPEPLIPGVDSIELFARPDLKAVQALLNQWTKN